MFGCGGVFAVCGPVAEKNQQGEAGAENWSYIGENGGGYEQVYTYRFVGEGNGDFDFDQRPAQTTYSQGNTQERFTVLKWALLCLGATGLMAVAIISSLLILTSSDPSSDISEDKGPSRSKAERPTPSADSAPLLGGMVFDCQAGAETWQSWSPAKRTYCCKKEHLHCAGPQTAGTTLAPPSAAPYNCKFETLLQTESWSFKHRQWCCSQQEKGCPPGVPSPAGGPPPLAPLQPGSVQTIPAPPGRPAPPPPTSLGPKQPGAAHGGPAPPAGHPPTHAPPVGQAGRAARVSCSAACSISGFSSTCGALLLRVAAKAQLAVHSKGSACLRAHEEVLAKCPSCKECSPQSAGCVEDHAGPKASAAPAAQGSEPAKAPKAPEVGQAPAHASSQEPPKDHSATVVEGEAYDCDAGLTNWPRIWSVLGEKTKSQSEHQAAEVAKKAWCCEHKHKGCPPGVNYDCDAGYGNWQRGWSLFKKAWCCQHKFKGCPKHDTMQFDCKEGFHMWEKTWSRTKQAWCCKHLKRGCPGKPDQKPEGATTADADSVADKSREADKSDSVNL